MKKNYKNRAMSTAVGWEALKEYFFPKANPPVTIKARSIEEAEEKLKALNNK